MPSLSTLLSTAATPPSGPARVAGTNGPGGGAAVGTTAGALFADLLPTQSPVLVVGAGRQTAAGSGIDLPAPTLVTAAAVGASLALAANAAADVTPALADGPIAIPSPRFTVGETVTATTMPSAASALVQTVPAPGRDGPADDLAGGAAAPVAPHPAPLGDATTADPGLRTTIALASAPSSSAVPIPLPASAPAPVPDTSSSMGSPMSAVPVTKDARNTLLARAPESRALQAPMAASAPAQTRPAGRPSAATSTVAVEGDDPTDASGTPSDPTSAAPPAFASLVAVPLVPIPSVVPTVTGPASGDRPAAPGRPRRVQEPPSMIAVTGSVAASGVATAVATSSADAPHAAEPAPPVAASPTTTVAAGQPGPPASSVSLAPRSDGRVVLAANPLSNAIPNVGPVAMPVEGAAPTPVIAVSAAIPVALAPMVPVALTPADGTASLSASSVAASPPIALTVQCLPPSTLASGSAGHVFAAALHAAAVPAAASAQGAGEDQDPMVAAMLAGSASAHAPPVVAAQGAAVDLSQSGWPTRMAEQIEALRDAADATSTSIRVIPDALGPVDLQVRRDGDQLHVHFSAANPETRTLIADARPQLAAAAADRGLKLGETSVGGGAATWGSGAGQGNAGQGTAGQGSGHDPARRSTPASARSATSSAAASDDAATDTRIA